MGRCHGVMASLCDVAMVWCGAAAGLGGVEVLLLKCIMEVCNKVYFPLGALLGAA